MKSVVKVAASLAFLLCFSVADAKADGVSASFMLAVNPTVASGDSDPGFGFQVSVLNLIINGTAEPGDQIAFYNSSVGGGLADSDGFSSLFSPTNVQLYSGPEAMPTMLDNAMLGFSGPIPLDDFFGSNTYSLTITPVSTVLTAEFATASTPQAESLLSYSLTPTPVSTPEPASLLLLGAGITGLFLMRRKRILYS